MMTRSQPPTSHPQPPHLQPPLTHSTHTIITIIIQGDHVATDDSVMFDASASWWTQGMSAALMPGLSAAVAGAIGRYGHVLFPRNVHDPALDLADAMLSHPSHSGYSRAFFSDDGSTAVEVALKMAFRKFLVDRGLLGAKQAAVGVGIDLWVSTDVVRSTSCGRPDALTRAPRSARSPGPGRGRVLPRRHPRHHGRRPVERLHRAPDAVDGGAVRFVLF